MRAQRLAVLTSLVLLATIAAPVQARSTPAAAGDYIVVFRDDVSDAPALTAQLARQHRFSPTHVWEHALKGFAASLPAAAVDALSRNPNVAWVEVDGMAYPIGTQSNATWGLDRIDQRNLPLNDTYVYDTTGAGVTAYVIDSGIRTTHAEFGGRARHGYDATGGNGQDCNGHGTHVAGTIGGATYGVAKQVNLVSVRVFRCSGGSMWSTIISGVDWVTKNAVKPAVANMSLGGGANDSIDTAVRNSIRSGVSYAIAAGNDSTDACTKSPARVAEAMTIGATNSSDSKASWSNYGSCVDWFAPGVSITSAWIDSDTDTHTISGTSMATPHTAGVAALYLQAGDASAAVVHDALYAATTKDIVGNDSGTANDHLLYNLNTGGGVGGDPNVAPVANADSATTSQGTGVTVNVLANDTDGDGDPLTVTNLTAADNGTVVLNADQTVTYTPTSDFAGTDSFTYRANDGSLESQAATVTVTVSPTTGGGDDTTFGITLATSSTNQGKTWTAVVTVTATSNATTPNLVDGVEISGSWLEDGSASAVCTTGETAAGQCQLSLPGIRKNTSSVTFTLETVSDTATRTWDGSPSVPETVTVLKP